MFTVHEEGTLIENLPEAFVSVAQLRDEIGQIRDPFNIGLR